MADDVNWPVEDIPDDDSVYMRAHRMFFRPTLQPGVFTPHGGGMSVDWEKYSSPEDTRQRAKNPDHNAVIRLPALGIRDINNLALEHTPEPENRAHSDVFGLVNSEDLTEARILLLNLSRVVLDLLAPKLPESGHRFSGLPRSTVPHTTPFTGASPRRSRSTLVQTASAISS